MRYLLPEGDSGSTTTRPTRSLDRAHDTNVAPVSSSSSASRSSIKCSASQGSAKLGRGRTQQAGTWAEQKVGRTLQKRGKIPGVVRAKAGCHHGGAGRENTTKHNHSLRNIDLEVWRARWRSWRPGVSFDWSLQKTCWRARKGQRRRKGWPRRCSQQPNRNRRGRVEMRSHNTRTSQGIASPSDAPVVTLGRRPLALVPASTPR